MALFWLSFGSLSGHFGSLSITFEMSSCGSLLALFWLSVWSLWLSFGHFGVMFWSHSGGSRLGRSDVFDSLC